MEFSLAWRLFEVRREQPPCLQRSDAQKQLGVPSRVPDPMLRQKRATCGMRLRKFQVLYIGSAPVAVINFSSIHVNSFTWSPSRKLRPGYCQADTGLECFLDSSIVFGLSLLSRQLSLLL